MGEPFIDAGKFIDWVWALREERDQLRAENERLRKDAERYRWASSGVQEAETLMAIVSCHGGYTEKISERVDAYLSASKEDNANS